MADCNCTTCACDTHEDCQNSIAPCLCCMSGECNS